MLFTIKTEYAIAGWKEPIMRNYNIMNRKIFFLTNFFWFLKLVCISFENWPNGREDISYIKDICILELDPFGILALPFPNRITLDNLFNFPGLQFSHM